jgi:hypothetical protein
MVKVTSVSACASAALTTHVVPVGVLVSHPGTEEIAYGDAVKGADHSADAHPLT